MGNCIIRIISSDNYKRKVIVFGLGHYKKYLDGRDEFSKKIYNYHKKGWYTEIEKETIKLFNLRLKNYFDIITVIPSSKKETINENLKKLAIQISKNDDVVYKQILLRTIHVKPTHGLKTTKERIENIKNSLDIVEDLSGKRVLLLDNVSISGTSIKYSADLLYKARAKEVAGLCLGLSVKDADNDWGNFNETLKYSQIKTKLFKGATG